MKFLIGNKEYDAETAVSKVSLQTLYVLKVQSGIGVKTLVEATKKFGQYSDPLDVLDNEESLNAFRILIWLARRHAGENLNIDEANDFPLDEFAMVVDDQAASDDPKEPEPMVLPPDAEPEPAAASNTSRTSKRRSTSGSS